MSKTQGINLRENESVQILTKIKKLEEALLKYIGSMNEMAHIKIYLSHKLLRLFFSI